jgi:hypothetical protein
MIQHKKRNFPVKVLPKIQIGSPEQLIITLQGICEQRFYAYSVVPYQNSLAPKFAAIQAIRYTLDKAKRQVYWRESLRLCIKLYPYFEKIAIRTSDKGYANYMAKLDACIDFCNEAIGWRMDK